MKLFEVVSLNREFLQRLNENGVRTEDYRYVEMYSEYERMIAAGEKYEYILAVLADRYGVSKSSIYRIVSRLKSTFTM